VFKKKIFLDPKKETTDPAYAALEFHQAVYDVLMGFLPVTENVAVPLGALKLQLQIGDAPMDLAKHPLYFDAYVGIFAFFSLVNCCLCCNRATLSHHLPPRLIQQLGVEKLVKMLVNAHATYRGKTKDECRTTYLRMVKRHKMYGATLFHVEVSSFCSRRSFADLFAC
jgi:hypothetical protein